MGRFSMPYVSFVVSSAPAPLKSHTKVSWLLAMSYCHVLGSNELEDKHVFHVPLWLWRCLRHFGKPLRSFTNNFHPILYSIFCGCRWWWLVSCCASCFLLLGSPGSFGSCPLARVSLFVVAFSSVCVVLVRRARFPITRATFFPWLIMHSNTSSIKGASYSSAGPPWFSVHSGYV